MKSEHVW